LDGHLEELTRDRALQAVDEVPTPGVGEVAVDDGRERVDGLAVQEDVELDERRLAEARHLVVERRVAARAALQLVVEVEDDLGQGEVVDDLLALLDGLHGDEAAAALLA